VGERIVVGAAIGVYLGKSFIAIIDDEFGHGDWR
jgi:hypothetical protein